MAITNSDLIAEMRSKGQPADHLGNRLADALEVADKALDYIATRVTDDDYDNPSSALEAIGDAVAETGREND